MSELLSQPKDETNRYLWLKQINPNAVNFLEQDGLFLEEPVNPSAYDTRYFSEAHIAYQRDGYSAKERRTKYADAISNIKGLVNDNPQSPIIDLGCGPGYLVQALREQGMNAYGVDISSVIINGASDQPPLPLIRASLTSLPFMDNQFEAGYSFHVLEHLTPGQIREAIGEISRIVLYQLYLIIPTWNSLSNKELFNQIVADPTHRVIATRDWWIKQFMNYGWRHNDQIADKFDRIKRGWVFFFEK